jgi:anaerobic selenocysteine-containing dehydrogenase
MRDEIARIVPFYDGVQHLRDTGDAIQYGGPHLCVDWKFATPDGKAHFRAVELPRRADEINGHQMRPRTRPLGTFSPSDAERVSEGQVRGSFIVSTRRGKQFNSLVYAEIDPLNGAPRDAVLMNADDATALSLSHNERVVLRNELGRYEGRVFLAPIARGNLQIHWPEGNVIIRRGVVDQAGGVPDYNARVSVEKV